MAFSESLAAFFSTSDFAVSATFTPKTGNNETANVILDAPSQMMFGGDMIGTDYVMRYRASDLPTIVRGCRGIIGGVTYVVREAPQVIDDGNIKIAKLGRDPDNLL